MSPLAHHGHICEQCEYETIHHTFDHEDEGDTVEFWCKHCEEDVQGQIGEHIYTQ